MPWGAQPQVSDDESSQRNLRIGQVGLRVRHMLQLMRDIHDCHPLEVWALLLQDLPAGLLQLYGECFRIDWENQMPQHWLQSWNREERLEGAVEFWHLW